MKISDVVLFIANHYSITTRHFRLGFFKYAFKLGFEKTFFAIWFVRRLRLLNFYEICQGWLQFSYRKFKF